MNEDLPITGLCIVAQTCPAGYVMIDKCEDNPRTEADLWKDHIFAKKVKRFLCVTRVFPLDGGRLNNVLIDVCLNEERDPIPAGYSMISTTQDTGEPACKKKQMSVKLVSRNDATDAINDLQFLCKNRRAPHGYTIVGELNGLMLCYRVGPVVQTGPPPTIPPRPVAVQQQHFNPYSSPPPVQTAIQGHADSPNMYNTQPLAANHITVAAAQRQNSRVHPLAGVPFEINPKLVPDSANQLGQIPEFRFRTRENIMHEMSVRIRVEDSASNSCPENGSSSDSDQERNAKIKNKTGKKSSVREDTEEAESDEEEGVDRDSSMNNKGIVVKTPISDEKEGGTEEEAGGGEKKVKSNKAAGNAKQELKRSSDEQRDVRSKTSTSAKKLPDTSDSEDEKKGGRCRSKNVVTRPKNYTVDSASKQEKKAGGKSKSKAPKSQMNDAEVDSKTKIDSLVLAVDSLAISVDGCIELGIYDSEEVYTKYMAFLDKAVAAAKARPGKITLYIASAPDLKAELIIEIIDKVNSDLFANIIHYHRKEYFEKVGEDFHYTSDPRVQIWLSAGFEKYFHTKWVAYEEKGRDHVEILLTSANLTYGHLKSPSSRNKISFDSMVRLSLPRDTFIKNFVNRMEYVCRRYRYVKDRDVLESVPGHVLELSETLEASCANFTPYEIYTKTDDFVKDINNAVLEIKPESKHTVWIASPFTKNEILDNLVSPLGDQMQIKILMQKDFAAKDRQFKPPLGSNIVNIDRFHCKFMAHVPPGNRDVDILMMSANFNELNMRKTDDGYENLDWLFRKKISRAEWETILGTMKIQV